MREKPMPTATTVAGEKQATFGHKTRQRVERGIYRRRLAGGGVRYEVCFVDAVHRVRWRTARSLREARQLRAELIVTPQATRITPGRRTFAETAEEWLQMRQTSGKRRLRKRTVGYYRAALDLVLLPRFGTWQLGQIDADAIAHLIRDLERQGLHAIQPERRKRPLGEASIENYLKPLQGVLAHALRRRWINSNPFDVLTDDDRPSKRERPPLHEWSPEEVKALIAASETLATSETSRYDYSSLIRLTAALGLRLSEALGLTWADFDKNADDGAGALHICRQWLPAQEYGPPKTKASERRIPLPAWLRDELIGLRLRSQHSRDQQPIFSSLTGTPLHHRNVTRRGFQPARDKAGLPSNITFHDLRHAAASRLINAGLDPVTVAGLLGHEDATTTLKIYAAQFDRRRTNTAIRNALAT